MLSLSADVRLLLLVAVNAIVILLAWRFVRRAGVTDPIQALLDTSLCWYLVQYLAVGLPGLFGVLNNGSMLSTALFCAIALQFIPATPKQIDPFAERRSVLCILAILLGFLVSQVWNLWLAPPLANDPLAYHLPAAVQWIQTGRIGLFETWLYNPANTYSPLAGSMFITWLMAPLGNDVLARFVQAPAIIMLFLATMQIARALGARSSTAALIALAVTCCRPMISQATLAKDDLFVVAFFAAALVSMCNERLNDRLGIWRCGVAVGLMLATKYTALLSLPILLFAFRFTHWKRFLAASGVALLVCSPWFIRNIVLTHNPIFPTRISDIFPGLVEWTRSMQLSSFQSINRSLVTSYFGATIPFAILVVLTYFAAIVFALRSRLLMRDSIARVVILGPILGIGLFIWLSPYDEARFILPAQALLIASVATISSSNPRAALFIAGLLGLVAAGTSFVPGNLAVLAPVWIAVTVAIAAIALMPRRAAMVTLGVSTVFIAGYGFVNFNASIKQYRTDAEETWRGPYGELADAWNFARNKLPDHGAIAYANTYFVFPLQGFDLSRRAVYAPVRRGLTKFSDLPSISDPQSGETVARVFSQWTVDQPQAEQWIANLRERDAKYVFIAKVDAIGREMLVEIPEMRFALQRDDLFDKLFENAAAVIFRIK